MFHDMGFGWMGLGWLFWLIVIAVFVYIVVKITNQNKPDNIYHPETPLEILKKRYAKGEISKEEFERIKKDIS